MSVRHQIAYSAWRRLLHGVLLALSLALLPGGPVQAGAPDDAVIANEFFQRNNMVAALPIYERLAARDLTSALFAERLAWCLLVQMELANAGNERDELIKRARFEAQRAKLLGSKSNLLQVMMDRLSNAQVHVPGEDEKLRAAEAAFARGDFDTALAGYEAIAASDPRSYSAHLFAGDVHFSRGNLQGAAGWFEKAIAIDPDIETAYRYWGDAIAKSGDDAAALPYYIRAVVAEPYGRKSWAGLRQWADRNGAKLQTPVLPTPKVELKSAGKGAAADVNIAVDPDTMKDARVGAVWLSYAMNRSLWMKGRFLERNPDAAAYRHSLQEELESLQMALVVAQREAKDPAQEPPALQTLFRLAADGLLEAHVLIGAPDEGLAQDYPAYRSSHREQLAAYIDRYVIRRGAKID